jgi:hypothetical protein
MTDIQEVHALTWRLLKNSLGDNDMAQNGVNEWQVLRIGK